MNPYPHHAALAGSPHHHPPGEPHHTGGGGGGGYGSSAASGNGTATTPDPSPHSPYGSGPQDPGPQGYQSHQQGQGMPSNGHHHAAAAAAAAQAMMQQAQEHQQQHHRSYQHPHIPGHMAGYPQVNHNNNCTIKQDGGPGMATSIQQCAGCGNRIVDRWLLHALERYWHNNCLKCTSCGTALAEIGPSCYSRGNMILCKNDYTRMFGNTAACATCGQQIASTELVLRSGGSVFHTKCFTCTKCGTQLRQGDRYYLLSGSVVCEADFNKIMKSTSVAAAAAATGNGGMPTRKGKVGRPRRSRE